MNGIGAQVKATVNSKKGLRPMTSDSAPTRGALRNERIPYKTDRQKSVISQYILVESVTGLDIRLDYFVDITHTERNRLCKTLLSLYCIGVNARRLQERK